MTHDDELRRRMNRMADEANLLFLCLGYLLVPALACALLMGLRRRRPA